MKTNRLSPEMRLALDLEDLKNNNDICIHFVNRKDKKSLCVKDQDGINHVFIDSRLSSIKKRSDLAHEISHILLDAFYSIDTPINIIKDLEKAVNIALIKNYIDFDHFFNCVKKGYTTEELSEEFCLIEEYIILASDYFKDSGKFLEQDKKTYQKMPKEELVQLVPLEKFKALIEADYPKYKIAEEFNVSEDVIGAVYIYYTSIGKIKPSSYNE